MSKVVQLIDRNALAVDQEQLASRIREIADQVEAGELGELERVVLVLDGQGVDYRVYGRPCNVAELVGLLEWAKDVVIRGVD